MEEEYMQIDNYRKYNILIRAEKNIAFPFTRKFGAIFEGLNPAKYTSLLFNTIFFLRRLLFSALIIQFELYAIIQI